MSYIMKVTPNVFVTAIVTILLPTVVIASEGKEVYEYTDAMGKIAFQHKKHQDKIKDCKACHTNVKIKTDELLIDWGNRTCRGCHLEMKNGITECTDCHKK